MATVSASCAEKSTPAASIPASTPHQKRKNVGANSSNSSTNNIHMDINQTPSLVEEQDDHLTPLHPHRRNLTVSVVTSLEEEEYEEYDEEMIQYNSQIQHEQYDSNPSVIASNNANYGTPSFKNTTALRRTPGASTMYKSAFAMNAEQGHLIRRTPGANAMHKTTMEKQSSSDVGAVPPPPPPPSATGEEQGTNRANNISSSSNPKNPQPNSSTATTTATSNINDCPPTVLGYGLAMPSPMARCSKSSASSSSTITTSSSSTRPEEVKIASSTSMTSAVTTAVVAATPNKSSMMSTPTTCNVRLTHTSSTDDEQDLLVQPSNASQDSMGQPQDITNGTQPLVTSNPSTTACTPASIARVVSIDVESTSSSSSTSNSNNNSSSNNNKHSNPHRPPLDPKSSAGRERYLYTPAGVSLAKNRNLNLQNGGVYGAMSPNTIQLTTSLDNLLDDGDVTPSISGAGKTMGGGSASGGGDDSLDEQEKITSAEGSTAVDRSTDEDTTHNTRKHRNEGVEASPMIHRSLSFEKESHSISAISKGFSSEEDWYEAFTLEGNTHPSKSNDVSVCDGSGSHDEVEMNRTLSHASTAEESMEEGPLRPKPVHSSFHRFASGAAARVASDAGAGGSGGDDRRAPTSTEAPQPENVDASSASSRPANFSGGGAFSRPSKQQQQQPPSQPPSQQPNHQSTQGQVPGTYVHTPKAKISGNANYQYNHLHQPQQPPPGGGHGNYDKAGAAALHEKSMQFAATHNHHHYNAYSSYENPHPQMYNGGQNNLGYDPNMYPFPSNYCQSNGIHPGAPSPVPFQHPSTFPMENSHIDFDFVHHQQPMTNHFSPLTVPPVAMSPPTVPNNYHMQPIQYPPPSPLPLPLPLNPSAPAVVNAPWFEANVHESQNPNQWVNMGDGGVPVAGWGQQQQHGNNGNAYPGSDAMGNPIMSTPTPPPMSQWVPPEYEQNAVPMDGMYQVPYNQNNYDPRNHEVVIPERDEEQVGQKPFNQRLENSARWNEQERFRNLSEQGPQEEISEQGSFASKQMNQNLKRSKNGGKRKVKKTFNDDGSLLRVSPSVAHDCLKKNFLADTSMKRKNKENQVDPLTVDSQKIAPSRREKKKSTKTKKGFSEDKSAEAKKIELVETQATRLIFKDFYRKFRVKERESIQSAIEFATISLSDSEIPESLHWRIYLELADLEKRANRFNEARKLYCKVCSLHPHHSQGWLEFSKLEEECGNLDLCSQLLNIGLQYCENNENLLSRAIKHEERIAQENGTGNLDRAREILAPLKHAGIDKVWRTVLEGAMMESRAGNDVTARRVLKYLMHWVPWYGPLYLEAFRLERDADRPVEASLIVERGLNEIPRYGPLWFGAFRLCEGLDLEEENFDLPRTMNMIERATKCISRELIWKVYLEAAQAQERAAHLATIYDQSLSLEQGLRKSRRSFAQTISSCPPNLCWKVWLAAGRMELLASRFEEARRLFLKSFSDVPAKGKPVVLLECSRLEEFVGDIPLARAILCKSRADAGSDWKVWLQSVSLEARCGNRDRAIQLAKDGLKAHSGTGRLWAVLVQLTEPDGEEAQMEVLKHALGAVPKSGEVWCEAARLFLNPSSNLFNLDIATLHLDFATKFTPQYGDSFLETLRLKALEQISRTIGKILSDQMKNRIGHIKWSSEFDMNHFFESVGNIIRHLLNSMDTSSTFGKILDNFDTSELELRCRNADPNYGKLWFHCRQKPTDTARAVLRRAKLMIVKDLTEQAPIYIGAMMRYTAVNIVVDAELEYKSGNKKLDMEEKEELLNAYLQKVPNNIHILKSSLSSANFVTGIAELNIEEDLQSLSLIDRRKILFGNDLLL